MKTPEIEILKGPNEKPITEIFAVLSVDEKGNEGICAAGVQIGSSVQMLPMVFAYERMLPLMRQQARQVAKMTGTKLKMARFTVREDLESFEP